MFREHIGMTAQLSQENVTNVTGRLTNLQSDNGRCVGQRTLLREVKFQADGS
jgi:hypothetical protein